MAKAKPRTRRKPAPKPRTPKEETAQQPVNGILVRLVPGEQEGSQVFAIEALGTVTVHELPTLLGLAAKFATKQLGL